LVTDWLLHLPPCSLIGCCCLPLLPVTAFKDLLAMPSDVVDVFGFALHLAQSGKKHDQAKPLKGFGGASACQRSLK
jgi:hypothetical protein